MKNIMPEFGPFSQPPLDEDNQIDSSPSSGGTRRKREKRPIITDAAEYENIQFQMADLVHGGEKKSWQPLVQADISGTVKRDGQDFFIDAMVDMRAAHQKSFLRRDEIRKKPGFYVHSFAVSDVKDYRGIDRVASPADVVGYYITAGSSDCSMGFFIGKTNRDIIKKIHAEIAHACSAGMYPQSAEDAIRFVYGKYSKLPMGIQDLWKSDHSGRKEIVIHGVAGGTQRSSLDPSVVMRPAQARSPLDTEESARQDLEQLSSPTEPLPLLNSFFYRVKGAEAVAKKIYRNVYHYELIAKTITQLVAEDPYVQHLPMLRGDFSGFLVEGDDESRYIDAIVSARRAFKREVYKKGRVDGMSDRPAFYVHSYAVRGSDVADGNPHLHSRKDIGGYFIIVGGGVGAPLGLFVRTNDRNIVKDIHEKITEDCSWGATPKNPEEAIKSFYEMYQNGFLPGNLSQTQITWIGRIVERAKKSSEVAPGGESHIRNSYEMPVYSWSEYRNAFRDARDVARLPSVSKQEDELTTQYMRVFFGFLASNRTGDESKRFVDEAFSAFPGGDLVYTRAVGYGEKERIPLQSMNQVDVYMLTAGVDEEARTIRIHAKDHEIAHKIHLFIFNKLRSFSDTKESKKSITEVLRDVQKMYTSPDDPSEDILIELI